MEFDVKVSAAAQTMEIITEIIDNKFEVRVNPSAARFGVQIDYVTSFS